MSEVVIPTWPYCSLRRYSATVAMKMIHAYDHATVEWTEPDIVVVRFLQGGRLDQDSLAEVMHTRKSFEGNGPQAVIAVIPEDLDFDPKVMMIDQYAANDMNSRTKALAIVTQGVIMESLVSLYFTYHPPGFEMRLFKGFEDAYRWLLEGPLSRSVA